MGWADERVDRRDPASAIARETNEAQLNIISERVGHALNRMLELGCPSYVHIA
jgi:hypothetical protein